MRTWWSRTRGPRCHTPVPAASKGTGPKVDVVLRDPVPLVSDPWTPTPTSLDATVATGPDSCSDPRY